MDAPYGQRPKLIAIVGPTASGKTSLAVHLALQFHGEIVSADSRQIYRGMDIGTVKPSIEDRRTVPHHLIDIRDPDERYTAAEYRDDALAAMHDIEARGRIPFLTGGTGLYVRAVIGTMDIPPVAPDPSYRKEIEAEIGRDGLAAVFAKLVALDPDAVRTVDIRSPRRVVRALEVIRATGIPFTARRMQPPSRFAVRALYLDVPSDILKERIRQRTEDMFRGDALLREVQGLVARYGPDAPAFDAIGYREIIAHLRGEMTLDEAFAAIVQNTIAYAKRQRTWFKKEPGLCRVTDEEDARKHIAEFLAE